MGLAPYGRPGVYDDSIFELRDGRAFLNYGWQKKFDKPCRSYADFKSHFQYYADIAYWVQQEAQRAILYTIEHRAGLCSTRNLAYSGGLALNAVANAQITTMTPFRNLYITPAAGNNGLAIGCAYYGWLEILKRDRLPPDGSSCFGRSYSDMEVRQAISNCRRPGRIDAEKIIDAFFRDISDCLLRDMDMRRRFSMELIIRDGGAIC